MLISIRPREISIRPREEGEMRSTSFFALFTTLFLAGCGGSSHSTAIATTDDSIEATVLDGQVSITKSSRVEIDSDSTEIRLTYCNDMYIFDDEYCKNYNRWHHQSPDRRGKSIQDVTSMRFSDYKITKIERTREISNQYKPPNTVYYVTLKK